MDERRGSNEKHQQCGSSQSRAQHSVAEDQAGAVARIGNHRDMRHERLEHEQPEELRRHVGDSVGRKPVSKLGRTEMLAVHRPQREQDQRRKTECGCHRARITEKRPHSAQSRSPAERQSSRERQRDERRDQRPGSKGERCVDEATAHDKGARDDGPHDNSD